MPTAIGFKNLLAAIAEYATSRREERAVIANFTEWLLSEYYKLDEKCAKAFADVIRVASPAVLAHIASRLHRASRIRRPIDLCALAADALREQAAETLNTPRRAGE